MAQDYQRQRTRLTKLEEKRSVKQAFLFTLLTIATVALVVYFGIPGLIKMVVFLGDLKSTNQKVENSTALPPSIPELKPPPEATNASQITVSGYAQPGTTIKLLLNNLSVREVVAGNDGAFIFDKVNLREGENSISTIAVSQSSVQSKPSREYVTIFNNKQPKLEVTSPKDGDKFFDKENQIKVEGISDPNISVYVNDRLSLTDSQGKFSVLIGLHEGDNPIKVKAQNNAGNEISKELKVSYSP